MEISEYESDCKELHENLLKEYGVIVRKYEKTYRDLASLVKSIYDAERAMDGIQYAIPYAIQESNVPYYHCAHVTITSQDFKTFLALKEFFRNAQNIIEE